MGQRMRGSPRIVSILMRSGTVGSEAQRRIVREQADYLIEPPMPDIGLRDWKKFDQAIQEGYDAAARLHRKERRAADRMSGPMGPAHAPLPRRADHVLERADLRQIDVRRNCRRSVSTMLCSRS